MSVNDPLEPNDSIEEATLVSSGDSFDDLSITERDTDFFAIEVERGQEISAEAQFYEREVDIIMILRGPNGGRIDTFSSPTGGEQFTHTVAETGTYYVELSSWLDSATSEYNFSISLGEGRDIPEQDRFEPNDVRDSATAVSSGESLEGLMATRRDDDYFAIDVERGQQISAKAQFFGDDVEINMALIGPSGRTVARSTTFTDNEKITHTATETGTYYFHVFPYSDAPGPYDFHIAYGAWANPPEPDRFEPNDEIESASPISSDVSFETLSITRNDTDVYAIEVGPGERIGMEIRFRRDPEFYDIELLRPNGSAIPRLSDQSHGAYIYYNPPERGTYYLTVDPNRYAPGNYSLSTSVYPGPTPRPTMTQIDKEGGVYGNASGGSSGSGGDGIADDSGGASGPGFGPVIAVLALIGMALLARCRQ